MGPRPFDLLLDLLTHAGRVVGKAELFERVWHGVAVTDNALTRAMKDLRRAMGDRASSPRYIDTVARRGYRFVADVRDLPIGRHVTVMVLPFDDLSAAPQAYIADGLADELIAQLGHANPDQLTVIGRASASAIGASDRPWAAAARRLGVDYAVRGSVRREGDRTRVSVQLIRLLDEASEWTEAFEAGRTGAFEARHELAEAIAGHLRVQLAERATTTPARSIDPDAHAAFLEGRHFLRTRTADGMAKAAGAFERAIAINPAYAPAHVGLAHSRAFALMSGRSKAAALASARASVDRALALDDGLAEAHAALALLQSADWKFAEAERSLRWAIALESR